MRVAIFYDRKGWAWWNKSHEIKKHLSSDIQMDIISVDERFDPRAYDLFLLFDGYLIEQLPYIPRNKVIVGCSNARLMSDAIRIADQYDCLALYANNAPVLDAYRDRANLYCCQNGVDTELFCVPEKKTDAFIACWVGNTKNIANKGLDLIQEACRSTATPLIALDVYACEHDASALWKHEQIRDNIYNNAAFYVCASEFEGTPNPALEAMACGLPVITTPVGNMPELIIDGYNGFLVERYSQSITAAMGKLRQSNWQQMGLNARKSIEDGWSWAHQANKYERMFREQHRRYMQEKQSLEEHTPTPAVTVVLSSLNSAAVMESCLKAFLHQTISAQKFEIIVISNVTDSSWSGVISRNNSYQNVTAIFDNEMSFGQLRNAALERARSSLVLFYDDLFQPAPEYIEVLLKSCHALQEETDITVFDLRPSVLPVYNIVTEAWFKGDRAPLCFSGERRQPDICKISTGIYACKLSIFKQGQFATEVDSDFVDLEFAIRVGEKIPLKLHSFKQASSFLSANLNLMSILIAAYREGRLKTRMSQISKSVALSEWIDSLPKVSQFDFETMEQLVNCIAEFDRSASKITADLNITISGQVLAGEQALRSIVELCLAYFNALGRKDELEGTSVGFIPSILSDKLTAGA